MHRLSADEKQACSNRGGSVERVLIGAEGCVVPTTDGGKACDDREQCQGLCEAPSLAAKGERVSGTCSTSIGRLGCLNVVIHGEASGQACFD
jgi:hypothetical protein